MLVIRSAELSDVPAILEIYNDAIMNTVATFDTEPRTLKQQEEWFAGHGKGFPVMVAEQDRHIAGWVSLTKYSERLAYAKTAELSVYIRDTDRGKGIGRTLIAAILEAGKLEGVHTVLSRIEESNESSLYLHRQFGFETVGTMREVGVKFGRLLNIVMMQKIL